MYKTLLTCLVCLTLVANTFGQEKPYHNAAEELQRDVTSLLLDKNIDEVIKQLDSETPSTVDSLLRRLLIYSRAGQPARVRATLEQLAATPNWQCPVDYHLRWIIRSTSAQTLVTHRFYYDQLCPDDMEGAEGLVRAWSEKGDAKELDAWLGQRSQKNDLWLLLRVQLRSRSGTAGEILDALAAEVRANPSDWKRLDRYLSANNHASNIHDVSWLADTFQVNTATDYFRLGDRIRHNAPQAAAKLLQKSLSVAYVDTEATGVANLIRLSAGLSIKINWEKQLRYWTKRSLADTYQKLNQSLAAQPLIEELVSMKGDDILLQDLHQLAGAVQSGSGHRVVETKILGDEVARRSTSAYWLERAQYYDGREEYELERNSYREALVALTVKADDPKALDERLEVVRWFAEFLDDKRNEREDKLELEKLLTAELRRTPPQTEYAFQIARLLTESDCYELRDSLLAKQPSFLARLLERRGDWDGGEGSFIEDVVYEDLPPALKDKIWSSLEPLVSDPGSTRAYHLANAMLARNESQRAIPLLRGYIDHARPAESGYKKIDATKSLFTAYCRTKQWQTAEKFLLAQRETFWRELSVALAQVAVAAAKEDAIDDAMRLWRMSSNLDRRNLGALPELAQTKAKPHLVAMYSKMKKEDPQSTIPDDALRLLQ